MLCSQARKGGESSGPTCCIRIRRWREICNDGKLNLVWYLNLWFFIKGREGCVYHVHQDNMTNIHKSWNTRNMSINMNINGPFLSSPSHQMIHNAPKLVWRFEIRLLWFSISNSLTYNRIYYIFSFIFFIPKLSYNTLSLCGNSLSVIFWNLFVWLKF